MYARNWYIRRESQYLLKPMGEIHRYFHRGINKCFDLFGYFFQMLIDVYILGGI